jgi:plastocyanin
MRTHDRQTTEGPWRLAATIGSLLTTLLALAVCDQIVQPAFAAPAADITAVNVPIDETTTTAASNTPREAVVQQTAGTPENAGAKVSIINFVFTPAEITIAPGESVTWTNDDGAPHGLVYKDGAKGTDLLLPGVSFSRQFDHAGTYDYSCAVHPYMIGRVIVRAQ